ncbi:MAG: hypothetical protein BGO48_15380 [Mucilaginibacter sp. 44-25]|nr:MAG: hypothetical protein BGO48_15380 [Mucilaginibacter sp. 44-25]
MTAPVAAGDYYSPTSITLSPGFSFTAASGQSLRLFISNCLFLGTLPSANQNYVLKSVPRIAINDANSLNGRTACELMQTVQYLDGLGRPLQTVQVKGSPTGGDIVLPRAYDPLGRESMKYLPYTVSPSASDGSYKTAALADQATFYAGSGGSAEGNRVGGVIQTPAAFAQTGYETSPLARMVEQGSPGLAWQTTSNPDNDHTLRASFTANDQSSNFSTTNTSNNPGSKVAAYYQALSNSDGSYNLVRTANTATYLAGMLTVTILKNENWKTGDGCFNTTEEYSDKEGNVVLRRTYNVNGTTAEMLSTYYVYDERNQLAFVLPPGVNPDNTTAIPNTSLQTMAYQYRYDARGRLTQKKVPGKGWQYIVYNKLNQSVATQDSVQRMKAPQQWTVTKYDATGRPVITGIYEYGTTAGSNYYNDVQNAANAAGILWESTSTTGNGYTNVAWPTSMATTLKVMYYDKYSGIPGFPSVYDMQGSGLYSKQTNGLITATKTLVLNTSDYLWTVQYYDDEGAVTRTLAQHYLGGSSALSTFNYDDIALVYNFVKQPVSAIKKHFVSNGGTSASLKLTVSDAYTYDHMGRKLSTVDTLRDGNNPAQTPVTINNLAYNEIGQVIKKGLHSLNGSSFLQNVDYRYNARGWLTNVNNPSLNGDGGLTNADTDGNDLFGLELKYQNAANAQYNGNIGSAVLKTGAYSGTTYNALTFNYGYDKLNRLTSSVSTSVAANDGFYNENITYNTMGNILSLKRYDKSGSTAALIDDLTYSYNGYQHNRIDDAASTTGGFNDAVKQAGEYAFDGNGNELKDLNKGLASVAYNVLELPQLVTKSNGSTISYIYDADGRKLRKLYTNSGTTTVDEYINGTQYEYVGSTPAISFVQTEEGRARKSGSVYKYEYDLKDQLGNTRVTFTWNSADAANQMTPQILQRNDYYAFGYAIASLTGASSPKNEYLYNGKELQEETDWYDYGARYYDAIIGKWAGSDPLGELTYHLSPYNYVDNNPVRNIDPMGMSTEDFLKENGLTQGDISVKFKVINDDSELQDGDILADFTEDGDVNLTKIGGKGEKPKPKKEVITIGSLLPGDGSKRSGGIITDLSANPEKLNTANNWLGYAGYGEATFKVTQIGMLEYRQTLSITSKIGTFSNFSGTYKAFGITGKVLGGAATYIGAPLNTYIDLKSMQNGEIGLGRFSYRTTSTFLGIGVGYYFGPIPGAIVGGLGWATEKSYDGFMIWLNATGKYVSDFNRGLSNGWYPGR